MKNSQVRKGKGRKGRSGKQGRIVALTPGEIELLRTLHDEFWGVAELAKKFELSVREVEAIVKYQTGC